MLLLVDGLQCIHFKKNLKTLLATPCRPWLGPEGEAAVSLSGCPTWKQFSLVVPSGALSPLLVLLLLLLLWVVGEPSGSHWRAGLGVAVLDSGPDRGVAVLDFRLAEGMVILACVLGEGLADWFLP